MRRPSLRASSIYRTAATGRRLHAPQARTPAPARPDQAARRSSQPTPLSPSATSRPVAPTHRRAPQPLLAPLAKPSLAPPSRLRAHSPPLRGTSSTPRTALESHTPDTSPSSIRFRARTLRSTTPRSVAWAFSPAMRAAPPAGRERSTALCRIRFRAGSTPGLLWRAG